MGISFYDCAVCHGRRCARNQKTNPAFPQDNAPVHTRCKPNCKGGQSCFERTSVVEPVSVLAGAEGLSDEIDVPSYLFTVYDGYHHYLDPEHAPDSSTTQVTSGMVVAATSPYFFVNANDFYDDPQEFLEKRGADYLLACNVYCRSCWLKKVGSKAAAAEQKALPPRKAVDAVDPLAILAELASGGEAEDTAHGAGAKRPRSEVSAGLPAPEHKRLRLERKESESEEDVSAAEEEDEDEEEEDEDDSAADGGPEVPLDVRCKALNVRVRNYLANKETKRSTEEVIAALNLLTSGFPAAGPGDGGDAASFIIDSWGISAWLNWHFNPEEEAQCKIFTLLVSALSGKVFKAGRVCMEVYPPYVPPASGERAVERQPYVKSMHDPECHWLVKKLLAEMLGTALLRGLSQQMQELLDADADASVGTFNRAAPVLLACSVLDSKQFGKPAAPPSKSLEFLRQLHAKSMLHPAQPIPIYTKAWVSPAVMAAKQGHVDALRLFIEESKTLDPTVSFPVGAEGPVHDDDTGEWKPAPADSTSPPKCQRPLVWTAAIALQADVTRYLIAAIEAAGQSLSADVAVAVTNEEADVLEGQEGPAGETDRTVLVPVLGAVLRAASEQGLVHHSPAALETVKLLVSKGAHVRGNVRPDSVPPRGALWVLLGSHHARPEIVTYLLHECACHPDGSLQSRNPTEAAELPSSSDTPLSRAISHHHWKAVDLLLEAGANKALLTPEDAARLAQYEEDKASGRVNAHGAGQCIIM